MEYRSLTEWTFEQAQAEQEKTSEPNGTRQPIILFFAFRELEYLENQFEKTNNGFFILHAIRKCANHNIELPMWLAKNFISRFDQVLNYRVGSWDDAFDRPIAKGAQLAARRKKRNLQIKVFNDAKFMLAMHPNQAVDKSLFEAVGKLNNLGTTQAEEFYYSAKRILGSK